MRHAKIRYTYEMRFDICPSSIFRVVKTKTHDIHVKK